MCTGTLAAEGLGAIPDLLLEEGLEKAVDYFMRRKLNPLNCYAAYLEEADRMFSSHWMAAELQANTVLWTDPKYKNARIMLGIEPMINVNDRVLGDRVTASERSEGQGFFGET